MMYTWFAILHLLKTRLYIYIKACIHDTKGTYLNTRNISKKVNITHWKMAAGGNFNWNITLSQQSMSLFSRRWRTLIGNRTGNSHTGVVMNTKHFRVSTMLLLLWKCHSSLSYTLYSCVTWSSILSINPGHPGFPVLTWLATPCSSLNSPPLNHQFGSLPSLLVFTDHLSIGYGPHWPAVLPSDHISW